VNVPTTVTEPDSPREGSACPPDKVNVADSNTTRDSSEPRFTFFRLHIPTGRITEDSCYARDGLHFLHLLNSWNSSEPGIYQYWEQQPVKDKEQDMPLAVIEALQAAHLALNLKADSRKRWTNFDQRAIEKLRSVLTALGAPIPLSTLFVEIPRRD